MTEFAGMLPIEKTFQFLVRSRNPRAADAIAYAVLNSSGEARRVAVSAAIDLPNRATQAAILEIYHDVPPDLQTAAVARSEAFLPLLRQNIRSKNRQLRENACEFLVSMDDTRAAHLLAELLQDPVEEIKKKAQEGLLSLAHNYHTLAGQVESGDAKVTRQILDTKRYALLDALLTALRHYKSHERPEMIATLMSLDPRGDEVLMDILGNPSDRRRKIALDILETAYHRRAIAFILSMLKNAKTAPLAVEILETRFDDPFVAALLSDRALLENPRITGALSRVKFVPWLRPGTEKASALPPRLAVRAARFLLCTGTQAHEKASILERLAASGGVALSAAAKFALSAIESHVRGDRLDAGLEKIEDRCPEIAEVLAEPDPEELLAENRRVVAAADGTTILSDEALFRNFVNSFDSLSRAQREISASDFEAKGVFLRELKKLLCEPEADVVLRAIKIVEWREYQEKVPRELALLTKHQDGRVRSSAVRQLGKSAAYDALKALFDTLDDRDRRVLANTVEALESTGHKQVIKLLEPLMKHPDNRVRANAAKAAWSLGSELGRTVLVDMLKNQKPNMRLSALWGLRQIGAREEAAIIRDMTRNDPDERVRRSAGMTLNEMGNVI